MALQFIKNRISRVLNSIGNFGKFFQDEKLLYSMGRLLSFIIVITVCFDAVWSLVIFKKPWDFTFEKLTFGITAISAKTGSLLIERWADIKAAGIKGTFTGTDTNNSPTSGTAGT